MQLSNWETHGRGVQGPDASFAPLRGSFDALTVQEGRVVARARSEQATEPYGLAVGRSVGVGGGVGV